MSALPEFKAQPRVYGCREPLMHPSRYTVDSDGLAAPHGNNLEWLNGS